MSDGTCSADFEHWLKMDFWTLGEGICLAFGYEPTDWALEVATFQYEGEQLNELIKRACLNKALEIHNTPQHFINWLQSKDIPLPKGLLQVMDKQKSLTQVSDNDPLIFTHKTRLLKELLNAANKFWANYDPTDKTTAPTNKTVTDWLVNERGVSLRVAENMAQILRADHLPTGRK